MVLIVVWEVLMMIVVMAVNNFMDLVVRGSEIVVVEVSVMMIIVVIMVVMVFDNMISWLVVSVNMGIVVLNCMWIIEIVVSINLMVSSISNDVVEWFVMNWLMMHWLVVSNWSMVRSNLARSWDKFRWRIWLSVWTFEPVYKILKSLTFLDSLGQPP